MSPGPARGTIHLLLALAFLLGATGEAYGSHAGPGHAPDSGRDHPCTCVGTCHGAAAAPIPAEPDPYPSVIERLVRVEPAVAEDRVVSHRTYYLLPFANAPPLETGSTHG